MSFNLSEYQHDQLMQIPWKERKCLFDFWTNPYPSGAHCNSTHDSIYCWPTTPANSVVAVPCFEVIGTLPPTLKHIQASAYRICDENGQWLWGNWTNYSDCLSLLDSGKTGFGSNITIEVVAYISFIGSLVSLLLLTITMFIFSYFKSLQCCRLSVHKHLVCALIVRFALMVIIAEPLVSGRKKATYSQLDLLCKAILCIELWATMSSINWMFLEGFYLHNRITVSIFDDRVPVLFFCSVGWGLPLIFVGVWAWVMTVTHPVHCWQKYGDLPYTWILATPITVALIVNLFFLINILRILVTRLKAQQRMEAAQIRKTVRATMVLFPLLGIPNLLFFLNPGGGGTMEEAYMVTNAILQSSQGISVSILYCFLNGEVRTAIRKKYMRIMIQRNPNRRQKSFRTTSVYVSQTEWATNDTTGAVGIPVGRTKSFRDFSSKTHIQKINNTTTLVEKNFPVTTTAETRV